MNRILIYIVIAYAMVLAVGDSAQAYRYRTYDGDPVKWESGGDETFYAHRVSFAPGNRFRDALNQALQYFNRHPGRFVFDLVFDSERRMRRDNGRNEIWMTEDEDALDGAPGITYTYFSYDVNFLDLDKEIDEVDILYDLNTPYSTTKLKSELSSYNGNWRSFHTINMHELGHAMGLLHVNDRYNIMGSDNTVMVTNGRNIHPYIAEDAAAGMIRLYGATRRDDLEDLSVTHWKWAGPADSEYSRHNRTRIFDNNGAELSKRNVNDEPRYNVEHGQTIQIEMTYENTGPNRQDPIRAGIYLSDNDTITPDDRLLKEFNYPDQCEFPTLRVVSVNLPNDLPSNSNHFIGVIVDNNNRIAEHDETNNASYIAIHVNAYTPTATPTPTRTFTRTPTSRFSPTPWEITPTPVFDFISVEWYEGRLGEHDGAVDPRDLLLTLDQSCLYALDHESNAILVYGRDGSTGRLSMADELTSASALQRPSHSVMTDDGSAMIVGGQGNMISSWNRGSQGCGLLSGGSVSIPAMDGSSQIADLVITPDGRYIYASFENNGAIVLLSRDTSTGLIVYSDTIDLPANSGVNGIAPQQTGFYVTDMAVSKDGRFLYAVSPGSSTLYTFEINQISGQLTLKNRNTQDRATHALLTPDGTRLFVLSPDLGVLSHWIIDPSQGSLIAAGSTQSDDWIGTIGWSWGSSQSVLYTINPAGGYAYLLTPAGTFVKTANIPVQQLTPYSIRLNSIALSQDGRHVYIGYRYETPGSGGLALITLQPRVEFTPTPTSTPMPIATPTVSTSATPTPKPVGSGIQFIQDLLRFTLPGYSQDVVLVDRSYSVMRSGEQLVQPDYRFGLGSPSDSPAPIAMPDGTLLAAVTGSDYLSTYLITIDSLGQTNQLASLVSSDFRWNNTLFHTNLLSVRSLNWMPDHSLQLLLSVSASSDDNATFFEGAVLLRVSGPFNPSTVTNFMQH